MTAKDYCEPVKRAISDPMFTQILLLNHVRVFDIISVIIRLLKQPPARKTIAETYFKRDFSTSRYKIAIHWTR